MPQSWIDDVDRCRKAGVPEEHIEFQRKQNLAAQLVIASRLRSADFGWVGFDAFYEEDPAFLRLLDELGETFVGDVHKGQRIYLEDPAPYVPAPNSNKGLPPAQLKAGSESVRVDTWARQQPESAWEIIETRGTTKGKLRVAVLHRAVWLWDGKEKDARYWRLVVRKTIGIDEIKYSPDYPLLSSNDIVEFLNYYLPNRKSSEEEIFEQLKMRHERRQRTIDSAYRSQIIQDSLQTGQSDKVGVMTKDIGHWLFTKRMMQLKF